MIATTRIKQIASVHSSTDSYREAADSDTVGAVWAEHEKNVKHRTDI